MMARSMLRFSNSGFTSKVSDAALWALVLFSVGCQVVFGDFTLEPGAGGTAAAAGGSSPDASGGTNAGGSSAVSSTTGGTPDTCTGAPLYACSGAQVLKCVANNWQVSETCTAPLSCSASLGTCVACYTGQTRCTQTDVGTLTGNAETCSRTQMGWDPVSCAKGCTVVDGKNDICANCTSGDTVCASLTSGTSVKRVLRTCVVGAWVTTECVNGCGDATSAAPAACQ
jgi:hypothetical protein